MSRAGTLTLPDGRPLPPALAPAECHRFGGRAGLMTAYVGAPAGAAARATPLLLVHSVNAAASAAEVRPLFEHARARRPVWAPDLPGYGLSDRGDRPYTPRLMTDAVHETVAQMQARHGKRPVHALAVSLGCEFLARAAVEAPRAFASVSLVSPTGFEGLRLRRGPAGRNRGIPWLYAALKGPGWGGPLFRGLTRPGVIRYFLERTFGSKRIDEAMWAYDVLTTRVDGAEHAPLSFLSAQLFAQDSGSLYDALSMPVWMTHGVRGDFTDYRAKTEVEGRPNWRIDVMPTGAMPYFEEKLEFNAKFDAFLAEAERGLARPSTAAA